MMSFSAFFQSQSTRSQSDGTLENDRGIVSPPNSAIDVLDDQSHSIPSGDPAMQAFLRQEILNIHNDTSLNDRQKAYLMQSVMTRNHVPMSSKHTNATIQEMGDPLSQTDLSKTYHDINSNILGCAHYRRNCKLQYANSDHSHSRLRKI